MANTDKFLDKQGVKTLWGQALDTFVQSVDFDLAEADIDVLQANVADLQTTVIDGNMANRIEALENDNAQIDEKIETAIQGVIDGAPEALDTLKEVSDYIASDETRAADMIERINDLEAAEIPVLTEEEVIEICNRTYNEKYANEYIVADKDGFVKALSNISGTGSVTLEDDVDLDTQTLTVKAGDNLTLDLGGKALNLNSTGGTGSIRVAGGDLTVENGTITSTKRAISVYNGGTLTIGEGAKISAGDCALTANGAGSEIIVDSGEITAQEAGLLVTTGAKATINGGKISGIDNAPIMGNGTSGQGDVEIVMNDGELIANIQSAGYVACGVYMPNSGSFTMNGGSIVANGGAGVVCRGGKTTINAGSITTTAHPTLETGKVGDSRVVVPCSAIVYDKNSKYPAMDTLEVIIGKDAVLNGAHEDITVISEEEKPNIVDNR